ncbi:hypothetical protein KC19_VG222100 [Ceratodon purpureus]|uniref:Uncharacterized protein n=1 Tax=Ceratodon purpureus TaxID=3225 RepID=A0A8T0HTW8_CERPU|nr:hypothetical protein KC19_VG222100 [Ceratodon purpureus]
MVRSVGARWAREVRFRLWFVVTVITSVSWGFGIRAEAEGGYANRSFPAWVTGNISSYDETIQQAAYSAFAKLSPVTGIKYGASLTGDLANVTVEAVRLRVGSLRRYGVTLGKFTIPPGLRISNVSFVRVILVYRDFGNVSVYSSSLPGQVFASSLAGIRVYNGDSLGTATPLPALTAIALDNPIKVIIPPNSQPSYCVEYFGNGTVLATYASVTNASTSTYACFSRTLGDNYFALVGFPSSGKKSSLWKIIVGTVVGVFGFILVLSLFILCCRRQLRKRKIAKMQSQVDRGETLQPTVVGYNRAPVATHSRTRPVLERDYV